MGLILYKKNPNRIIKINAENTKSLFQMKLLLCKKIIKL